MPTITTNGTANAGKARQVKYSLYRNGIGGSAGKFFHRAYHSTHTKKAPACSSPGRMPARKSLGTDCSVTMPYRISASDGGITTPMVPDAPNTPRAKPRG